jgi:general stress protein 26
MATAIETADEEAREKVFDLIKDIKFAMMVTQDEAGRLYARPMANQKPDEAGNLWFFTAANSPKVANIAANSTVLLAYADTDDNNYVSVAGEARVTRDQAKIDELWSDFLKAWFPEGKDDPNVTLICVTPVSAEYWDNPSSAFVQAFGYLKAKVTGEPERMGDNKIVRM